jgi:hypothetical protein
MLLLTGAASASQGFLLTCVALVLLVFVLLLTATGIALWRVLDRWSQHHPVMAYRLATSFWLVTGVIGIWLAYAIARRT